MPPSPRFSLPPLTSPSPPPQPTAGLTATARRPKRSALEPPAFNHTRSTSPRQHITSPRSRQEPSQRSTTTTPRAFESHHHRSHRLRREQPTQEDQDLAALAGWSPDALNHIFTSSPQADADVNLLNDIANNEFSSPSNYPSFTTSNGDSASTSTSRAPFLSRTTSGASNPTSANENAALTTAASRILHDLDIMPPTTRRRRESSSSTTNHTTTTARASKRRRTATPSTRPKIDQPAQDDPFLSSPQHLDDPSLIDLTADDGKADLEKIREEKEREKEDNGDIIKLSKFQCVICMDDAKNLTTTHCGHLFCADCLHSSLNVESTRGRCPMCRAKLETKPREQYNARTKGFYPLEIKVMTRSKKGKRKVQKLS